MGQTLDARGLSCCDATVLGSQSAGNKGGMLVTAGGTVQIANKPHCFNQVLFLIPTGEESYYVESDIFRTSPG